MIRTETIILLNDGWERLTQFFLACRSTFAIKYRMEETGLKQKDLVEMFGFKSWVTEIMNRKHKLTLDMI